MCSCANVPCMLTCLMCLRDSMLCILRANKCSCALCAHILCVLKCSIALGANNVPCILTCSCALCAYVAMFLLCSHALHAYVLICQCALFPCVHVPTCFAYLRASSPLSRMAYVITCQRDLPD